MSDSDDSDDEILMKATFKKPKRSEIKKKLDMERFMDEALLESEKQHANLVRIQKARQEHGDDDNLENLKNKMEAMEMARDERKRQNEFLGYDDAFPKQHIEALQAALDADKSHRLGFRQNLIQFSNVANVCFESEQDAMKGLEQALASCSTDLASRIYSAIELDILSEFIESERFVEILVETDNVLSVCDWLYKVAYSSGLGNAALGLLGKAAENALMSLRTTKLTRLLRLDQFLTLIENWVPSQKEATTTAVGDDTQAATRKNLQGLMSCLLLWERSVTLSTPDEATNCVLALIRIGLDDTAQINFRSVVQRFLSTIFDLVSIPKDTWMQMTARTVMDDLSDWGLGAEGSGDHDDENGWLCRSAAVRLVPMTVSASQFKAEMALCAAQQCLGEMNLKQTVLQELGQDAELAKRATTSLGWLSLATSYIILVKLDAMGRKMQEDPPRTLATLECMLSAFQTGLLLLQSEDGAFEYGSKSNRNAYVEFIGVFDPLCEQVSNGWIQKWNTHLPFQHADMLLKLLHQHNFATEKTAKYVAGTSNEEKQAKLSSFFAAKKSNSG